MHKLFLFALRAAVSVERHTQVTRGFPSPMSCECLRHSRSETASAVPHRPLYVLGLDAKCIPVAGLIKTFLNPDRDDAVVVWVAH